MEVFLRRAMLKETFVWPSQWTWGYQGSPLSDMLQILYFGFEVDNLPDFFLPIVIVTLGIFLCHTPGFNILKQCFNEKNLSFMKFNLIN